MARRRTKQEAALDFVPKALGLIVLGCFFVPLFRWITLAVLGVITVAGLVFVIVKLVKGRSPETVDCFYRESPVVQNNDRRYTRAESLITEGEREFYKVLKRAVPEAEIHAKVRVSDVIRSSGIKFAKISTQHFDWVVCDPTGCEPLLAVELDDASHLRWQNKVNDRKKNEAAEIAGFPILRFKWAKNYDEDVVRNRIAHVVNTIADRKTLGRSQLVQVDSRVDRL